MNVANIDNLGHVHPDTMVGYSIGQCARAAVFADLAGCVAPADGRAGNARARCTAAAARVRIWPSAMATPACAWALTGDFWAADPACYPSDAELGLPPGWYAQAELTAWQRQGRRA